MMNKLRPLILNEQMVKKFVEHKDQKQRPKETVINSESDVSEYLNSSVRNI